MKRCTACGNDKPEEDFSIRSDTGKRYSQCRACKNEKSTAYYLGNTKKHALAVKRRYDTFGRFQRYGLTVDQYDGILASQGGKCALCQSEKPGGKGKWHIDHRHEGPQSPGFPRKGFNQCDAGRVRGLLCHRCNISLGHYEKLSARIGHDRLLAYLAEPAGGAVNGSRDVQPRSKTPVRASARPGA